MSQNDPWVQLVSKYFYDDDPIKCKEKEIKFKNSASLQKEFRSEYEEYLLQRKRGEKLTQKVDLSEENLHFRTSKNEEECLIDFISAIIKQAKEDQYHQKEDIQRDAFTFFSSLRVCGTCKEPWAWDKKIKHKKVKAKECQTHKCKGTVEGSILLERGLDNFLKYWNLDLDIDHLLHKIF